MPSFRDALAPLPLVAILRGLRPDEAVEVGQALTEAGFRVIEVPLNSPDPLRSIERLAAWAPDDVLVGAGTVTEPGMVDRVRDAGGRLVVMPHSDRAVVRRAKELGLACTPGVATPTEAFAALANGADALKLFPAEAMPPAVVKAWRAVLPREALLVPVGGIRPDTMAAYVRAGADGFGLGGALYGPGQSAAEVGRNARAFAQAWAELRDGS